MADSNLPMQQVKSEPIFIYKQNLNVVVSLLKQLEYEQIYKYQII